MPDDVTLILPEGSWDYPSSHGGVEYYPYRLTIDHVYQSRDNGGPWAIDVPYHVYPYFRKAGYLVMEPDQPPTPPDQIAMKRLRKAGGLIDLGCNWQGQHFEPNAEGIITVPHTAVGELVESHDYEEIPEDEPAKIDTGLDQLHEGVEAQAERVEQLREEALAQVPEEKVEAARAEVEAAHERSMRAGPPSPRRK